MPDDVHEVAFSEFQAELRHAISTIPFPIVDDEDIVAIRMFTNASVRVRGRTIVTYPDVHIRICSTSSEPRLAHARPYFFLECAFSQTALSVNRKLAEYINSFPKTVAVMKIVVEESSPFHIPPFDSDVAKYLANKAIPPWEKWMPRRDNSNGLGPVISHGITWIDISSIQVHIWIRTGSTPIDVASRNSDTQEYAIGVSPSFPNLPVVLIHIRPYTLP